MSTWVHGDHGCKPEDAVLAGLDADGSELYIGRAMHEGDLLPGKLCPDKGGLFVPYGGAEHSKTHYEVLCGHAAVAWQPTWGGRVPARAVVGGQTTDGEPLYIGRVLHSGILTPGKVHGSHGKLYIPFGGKEHAFDRYEVLVNV